MLNYNKNIYLLLTLRFYLRVQVGGNMKFVITNLCVKCMKKKENPIKLSCWENLK